MGTDFIDHDGFVDPNHITLNSLKPGAVAHKVGSLPMITNHSSERDFCLDENLNVIPDISDGVYVCDNSCFPYSPHANPSLTLAALAIRLSRHLRNPDKHAKIDPDNIKVMNQSGSAVQVGVSSMRRLTQNSNNTSGKATEVNEDKKGGGNENGNSEIDEHLVVLEAGDHDIWERTH